MSRTAFVVSLGAALAVGVLTVLVSAASLPECTTDSQQDPFVVIRSAPCGTYRIIRTRRESVGGVEQDVTVQYMFHAPAGPAKAMVVLFSGGIGQTGITGDPSTGQVFTSNNNFLVRSAQLFAERGYLAVTIDRPNPAPPDAEYQSHRLSARHAQDIVAVANHANRWARHVFLAGTSSGTLSVVAQSVLGAGTMISSPVTVGSPQVPFIGNTNFPNLVPSFVTVPVHVMAHAMDGCGGTPPANAAALHEQFFLAGISSVYDLMNGGFDRTGIGGIQPCDAVTYHGFLGIENAAVSRITARMDAIIAAYASRFPWNRRPVTRPGWLVTTLQRPVSIDLRWLAADLNGDQLSFSLPYATSSRGAAIVLRGTVATYWPTQMGITDGFVFVVSDGRGGRSADVVTVAVTGELR
jgi:hypothetical protein